MNTSPEYIHSELPAIELFKKLNYEYYDCELTDERDDITEVILKDRLLKAIKRINTTREWEISDNNVLKAYNELTNIYSASLMESNKKVWGLIRGATFPIKQVINGKEEFKSVSFIDYINPENNDFLVVNQSSMDG